MGEIIVTDHAIIRYIERVAGIDLQFVRDRIAEEVRTSCQARAVKYFDGLFTYVLDGDTVVTIIEGHRQGGFARRRETCLTKD